MPAKPLSLRGFLTKDIKRSQLFLCKNPSKPDLSTSKSVPNLQAASLQPSPISTPISPLFPPTQSTNPTPNPPNPQIQPSPKQLTRQAQLDALLSQSLRSTPKPPESKKHQKGTLFELRDELADLIEEEFGAGPREKKVLSEKKEVLIREIKRLEDQAGKEKLARSRVNLQNHGAWPEMISPIEKKRLLKKAEEIEKVRKGVVKPPPKRRRTSFSEQDLDGEDLLKMGKSIKKRQKQTNEKMRTMTGEVNEPRANFVTAPNNLSRSFEAGVDEYEGKKGTKKLNAEQKKLHNQLKRVMGVGEKVQKWLG